ncbi:MAG: thiamine pyrophosphate-binding protein [Pseudomonadota bacterium]
MPNSADIIAQRLHEEGVRYAFGVPGGEVLTMIDALERAGIRFVLARHENAAGFMAEGVWHGSGAPAVLIGTVGPGMANTVNVSANAEQDRVPLIVITGAVDEAEALSYTHQVFDHRAVLRPVVKASFEARAGACDVMIDKAIRIATDAQPGPVHIDLPISVAAAEHPAPRTARRALTSPAQPAGADLASARARFAQSQRPILMAGLDLLACPGAVDTLRHVAERFNIPVVTTYKAKGVLPEDHPLALGGHGLSPKSDAVILPLLGQADLVICVGYDPIEMRTGWRDPWDPADAIAFTTVPDNQYLHQVSAAWTCDVGLGLAALTEGQTPKPVWDGDAPAAARAALAAAFAGPHAWGPSRALHLLDRLKPAGMVTTVDSGAHRILLSQLWTCAEARSLLQSTGLCTMGCALPLAIGRKIAEPDRPVMAVMGDGCLDMVLGELATLRDVGLPVITVVLNDASLALIELKQRRDGKQNAGVDFGQTDYAAIARAVGITGVAVGDAEALEEAFRTALTATGPTLIDVRIPRRAYDGLI